MFVEWLSSRVDHCWRHRFDEKSILFSINFIIRFLKFYFHDRDYMLVSLRVKCHCFTICRLLIWWLVATSNVWKGKKKNLKNIFKYIENNRNFAVIPMKSIATLVCQPFSRLSRAPNNTTHVRPNTTNCWPLLSVCTRCWRCARRCMLSMSMMRWWKYVSFFETLF